MVEEAMAIVNGWVDWATRRPGIGDKIYSEPNRGLGLIGHSIVGSIAGALSRFESTAKDANGNYTPNAAASCMFLLAQTGELIQCYPVTASTWTSGGREANTSYWAIEAEGGPKGNESEPLTDAQVATMMRLCWEYTARTGRLVVRGTTFREHGEIAVLHGYAPTACPSGRYERFYNALAALDAPEPEPVPTVEEMLIVSVWGAGGEHVLPWPVRVANARWRMEAVTQGKAGLFAQPLAERIGSHVAAHPIGPHAHDMSIAIARTGPVAR